MAAFEVVPLDGPGGVGKSTAGQALADHLGYAFLSSGRIYRALAWWALRQGWQADAPPDPQLVSGAVVTIGSVEVSAVSKIEEEPDVWRVNGHAVDVDLGSDHISKASSVFSTHPDVRVLADQAQRDTVLAMARAGEVGGVILEGRDIGTVVFPDARIKFYLIATAEERARRRHAELVLKDPEADYDEVLKALEERDARDAGRAVAPLKPAADACIIDTTSLNLAQVVEAMLTAIRTGD